MSTVELTLIAFGRAAAQNPAFNAGRASTINSHCKGCGYETIMARDWQQKQRLFTKEFKRLAVIELL